MRKQSLLALAVSLLLAQNSFAKIHSVGLNKNDYTSDFMIGSVVVSVIFPESNGTLDPNLENWTDGRKTQVLDEIMTGLNWWKEKNTGSDLNFTFVSETVSTKYEPITRPYYNESLWIPDVMSTLGYNGSRFVATKNYVNDLRETYDTDWGFIIFVVDSQVDFNGKFSDGYFAYAYLGGPFMVMTYDNNGYGIANMDVVAAHEMGHIFHALDQYAGASSPSDYSMGYFPTINGNHAYASSANEPDSIMRGGLRWGLDEWTKKMIGWRDNDNNGRHDIVGVSAQVGSLASAAASPNPSFEGQANLPVVARQNNSNGYGFTVDTIAKVEYKVAENEWVSAMAKDGNFDSAEESFMVVVDASSLGAQSVAAADVTIRVTTAYDLIVGSTGGPSVNSTGSLSNAHAFPNPFKPNSGLNHVNMTFTGLTPAAKVQIFTAAGDPVFEGTADSAGNTMTWNVVNDSGSPISSGVYFFLISNDQGDSKKGKIAIIR